MKIARRISRRIRNTTPVKQEMNYDQIIHALLPIG